MPVETRGHKECKEPKAIREIQAQLAHKVQLGPLGQKGIRA